MFRFTPSLAQWLFDYHNDLLFPIYFGRTELFTPELQQEYMAWCETDEGKYRGGLANSTNSIIGAVERLLIDADRAMRRCNSN